MKRGDDPVAASFRSEYFEILMKIALCQLSTTVGAFTHNVDKICEFVRQAAAEKAQIAIFPELCLSSYPPLDLLDRPGFVAANAEAVLRLQRQLASIEGAPETIIFGSIVANPKPQGRAIHNAAVVLHQNETVLIQPKRLLPTYDVFDEARYFEPGHETRVWDSPYGKIGLTVCEDAWFDDAHLGRQIYAADPAKDLKGCDFVINISASPFELNKRKRRQQLLAGFVKRVGAPLVYVNQVGANDEILFDGASLVYSAGGDVLYEMPSFREGLSVIDFTPGKKTGVSEVAAWAPSDSSWEKLFVGEQKHDDELELLHKGLVSGIREYFQKTGFKRAVIGLSGGIDSAVVACLAAEALGPRNVLGVSMPSQYSSSHSLADADALARAVGLEYRILSLKFIFTTLLMEVKPAFLGAAPDATEENMQARLRGVMLMALANKRNGLVLTTGNKSALAVGYCTTYGDLAGALAPPGDLHKRASTPRL
ncbi:MAG: NAD(+) synthase [Deltaproteobacteria bacterium]|nr:NAD(+) synthase [Deltaproteobacteria bacterium]